MRTLRLDPCNHLPHPVDQRIAGPAGIDAEIHAATIVIHAVAVAVTVSIAAIAGDDGRSTAVVAAIVGTPVAAIVATVVSAAGLALRRK